MRPFIISTETNSDLPAEYLAKNNILVIPHYYTVDEEVYGEEKELSVKDFYNQMREGRQVATMASNPAVIDASFRKAIAEGNDILHISFSSALSGGYSNVVMGAREIYEEVPEARIEVIDTLTASLGEGLLIMKAIQLKDSGHSLDEIKDAIEKLKSSTYAEFTVDDLNHLQKGGRISKTTAVVGTLVNLKPILGMDKNGKIVSISKTRGRKKSLALLMENMKNNIGEYNPDEIIIGIVHGDCEEDALYLQVLIMEQMKIKHFCLNNIGPSIGAHTGPGTVGLMYFGKEK